MTPQLLILGNGFDLHCGLKSSYRNFFRSEILDTIGESFGLKQLQSGVSGFWESLLLEYYKTNNKDDYAWCDIERIIKDTLFSLIMWQSKDKESEDIADDTDIVAPFLNNYITNFYGRSLIQPNLRYQIPLEVDKNLFSDLLKHLYNLENRFCKYLKNQIVNPYNENEKNEKYLVKAVNLLATLTGFAHYKFHKLDDFITVENKKYLIDVFDNLNDVFILNFNYTALFNILDVESPCYFNNVHGKICNNKCVKDCKASEVIFGIDDNQIQSKSANSELRLFSKTYRKMLNSDKYITALPPNDVQAIVIKFYGHSLSEADYSYFQSIFDYYDLYSNSNVSLIFYYSKGYEIYDSAYKLISEYGKTLTNKDQGKNLIHKLLLENRLHIQEVKD